MVRVGFGTSRLLVFETATKQLHIHLLDVNSTHFLVSHRAYGMIGPPQYSIARNPTDALITASSLLFTTLRGGHETTTTAALEDRMDANVNATIDLTDISGGHDDSFISPQAKSIICMSLAMACHYLGYSLARSITVSLFTSETTGFKGSRAAFPFAMTFISPVSLGMLIAYGNVLDHSGAKLALVYSTIACAAIIQISAILIYYSLRCGWKLMDFPAVKLITGVLFVFRESYVQLLTSQYWSFMASALSPDQSAKWFGPIAGLTSITSAIAGTIVAPVVRKFGLTGGLMGTSIMLLASVPAVSMAYGIARSHGFEPKKRSSDETKRKGVSQDQESVARRSMLRKATDLFQRVPVLLALFREILASQGLATLLNVCFVACIGNAIADDDQRAGWLGRYYALINIITMVLQFAVLPPLMTVMEPKQLWRILPILPFICTALQVLQNTDNPSLKIVSASLLVMKVSEYSARRMLDEIIFVPLDFESRYLGKEVLGVFGYRLGKSLMSLAVSVLSAMDGNFNLRKQSILSNIVCAVWVKTAWALGEMVPTRAEAEEAHQRKMR